MRIKLNILACRNYVYSVMETYMNSAYTTRYKCCNGWVHLRGDNGCTHSTLYDLLDLSWRHTCRQCRPAFLSANSIGRHVKCQSVSPPSLPIPSLPPLIFIFPPFPIPLFLLFLLLPLPFCISREGIRTLPVLQRLAMLRFSSYIFNITKNVRKES